MFYSCIRCCSSIVKNTIPKNSNFVLLSGGIDSAVLLAHQKDKYNNACGIFFDYCQRAKDIELLASKTIANDFDCHLVELSLHSLGKEFQNINKLHVPLPDRNLILLSIALSYIHTVGGTSLSIGINKDDLQKDYSTAKLDFLDKFKGIIELLHPELSILTPFLDYTKSDVIHRGVELGVDFSSCYSCMRIVHSTDDFEHCGNCMQCKERKQAFINANISDVTLYKS